MNDTTPWSNVMTFLRWGKWALGLFALNYYGALIDALFFVALGVIALAVIADHLRNRRLLRRWHDHCQQIADQHVAHTRQATVTALPDPTEKRAA